MRTRIALLTLAIAGVAAIPALAADYTGTVGASNPSFAWDGGPGTSLGANVPVIGGASVGNFIGCFDGIADCEETLLKIETAGKLTVTTDSADDANDTIDLYLWKSDASGAYDDSGADLAEGGGAGTTGDETLSVQVTPGFYVAQVKFFLADGDTYKGKAVLSGFAAPPAPPAPSSPSAQTPSSAPPSSPQSQPGPQSTPAPAPASKPAPSAAAKKKAAAKKCKAKAKKIKNSKKRAKALKRCAKLAR